MNNTFPGLLANLLLFAGLLILVRTLSPRNELSRLALASLAILLNIRYFQWRLESTMDPFLSSPASIWHWIFAAAESIALFSLCLHLLVLIQRPRTAAEKGHEPYKPNDKSPEVDVFIATYNEEAELLRPTIQAACRIDYPNYKVHVLDDSARDWLKDMCEEIGVNYIARQDRKGFKAGNLNHALQQTHGSYILCLDADFVVEPNILIETLGYFKDDTIAIVQTPQFFHNPDAIQLNLGGDHAWPEEQRVFTDIMQPCRDNWDNAFCYGTNFVIRRSSLDKIGGFPTESICEDLLLTYKLKKYGLITRYHHAPLASGQAADTLGSFIAQRARWCTGTLQCLLIKDGPIRSSRLSLRDRIFFFDTMAYYLGSIWFFLLLLSPAVFWWFGRAPFDSDNGHALMLFAPRVLASTLILYWLTERKVIPIISEIGRFVSIFHLMAVIVTTLFHPTGKVFKVTDKNLNRSQQSFNWRVAMPHLILLAITIAGMVKTLVFGQPSENTAVDNIGLILALTIFYFWVVFLTLLACIEPPFKESEMAALHPVDTGSLRKSFFSVARKVTE